MRIVQALIFDDEGKEVTVTFADGSTETRAIDNLHDLWLFDVVAGEYVQWGEDGLFETTEGWQCL